MRSRCGRFARCATVLTMTRGGPPRASKREHALVRPSVERDAEIVDATGEVAQVDARPGWRRREADPDRIELDRLDADRPQPGDEVAEPRDRQRIPARYGHVPQSAARECGDRGGESCKVGLGAAEKGVAAAARDIAAPRDGKVEALGHCTRHDRDLTGALAPQGLGSGGAVRDRCRPITRFSNLPAREYRAQYSALATP